MMNEKIVYILGAGMSVPAGVPSQNDIMSKCLEDADFYNKVKGFYREFYLLTSTNLTRPAMAKIPLEDIFSLLDRSIKSAHKYKNFTVTNFIEIENIFMTKIASYLETINVNNDYILEFVKNIITARIDVGQSCDKISIISMNWDNLMDNAIKSFENLENQDKVGIDYCMYDYMYEDQNSKSYIPSTHKKVKGYNNIKLIKLHGSINWNICYACNKVYINHKIINTQGRCNSCDVELEKFMLSPTFMKEFQANHIKNIWHNALIDISEATKIIFIGYSLPLSDFEFKIMLSKAINRKNKVNIKVIDFLNDDKQFTKSFVELKDRYNTFFGTKIQFYSKGIKQYIKDEMQKDLNMLKEEN
jgi:hypothetical protein